MQIWQERRSHIKKHDQHHFQYSVIDQNRFFFKTQGHCTYLDQDQTRKKQLVLLYFDFILFCYAEARNF